MADQPRQGLAKAADGGRLPTRAAQYHGVRGLRAKLDHILPHHEAAHAVPDQHLLCLGPALAEDGVHGVDVVDQPLPAVVIAQVAQLVLGRLGAMADLIVASHRIALLSQRLCQGVIAGVMLRHAVHNLDDGPGRLLGLVQNELFDFPASGGKGDGVHACVLLLLRVDRGPVSCRPCAVSWRRWPGRGRRFRAARPPGSPCP